MKNHAVALPCGNRIRRAFTLIEMLAVIVIIGILLALAVPMMKSPGRALELKSTADLLKGDILLARQEAVTLNGQMEIRFFRKGSADPFSAYQIFSVDPTDQRVAHSAVRMLPAGLVFSVASGSDGKALSPLLTESLLTGTQNEGVPAIKGWNYSAVLIGASGAFSNVAWDRATITLVDSKAPVISGNLPRNYAQVTVQPLTGMVSVTQP